MVTQEFSHIIDGKLASRSVRITLSTAYHHYQRAEQAFLESHSSKQLFDLNKNAYHHIMETFIWRREW